MIHFMTPLMTPLNGEKPTTDVENIINSRVTPQQARNDVLYWKRCVIIKFRE